jgi:uncharacterized membrane protein
MQRVSGWLWKVLILPACLGYQVLVHSVLVGEHGRILRLALAAIPLLLVAYWVAKSARNKLLWTGVLAGAMATVYAVETQEQLGLPAMAALTHAGINLFMLWVFGRTLRLSREPLITGFARRVHGTLPSYIEAYTRRVTLMWCVFFVSQVVVSAALFAFATLDEWSFFVNMLSLPLVVLMFVGEYGYRVVRYRAYNHASILKGVQMFADGDADSSSAPGALPSQSIVRDVHG